MKTRYIAAVVLVFMVIISSLIYLMEREKKEVKKVGVVPHAPVATATLATKECPNTFISWNIANFGKSRSDEQIAFMAGVLRNADIVAVQEVTAGKDAGVQAIAKLADALSRTGADWDYVVSDPTAPPSTGVERYAYLFKKSAATINRGNAHLVHELEEAIDREPYALAFHLKDGGAVQVFTIHTVPTEKHPIREVEALAKAHEVRSQERAIISGDFNLGPEKTDSPLLGAGYTGHIAEPTSLKSKTRNGQYLAHQYDNIYTKGVKVCTSGVVDFVKGHFSPVTQESLAGARGISDHLPVFATFR